MIHNPSGKQDRDGWKSRQGDPIVPPTQPASTKSRESSPGADTKVEAGRPLEQTSNLYDSTREVPKGAFREIMERSGSRSTKELLLLNAATTACMAGLGLLIYRDFIAFAEGISMQPPVVILSASPVVEVVMFGLTCVMWRWSGVPLIERGWKAVVNKPN